MRTNKHILILVILNFLTVFELYPQRTYPFNAFLDDEADYEQFVDPKTLLSEYSLPHFPYISDSLCQCESQESGIYFFCYIKYHDWSDYISVKIIPLKGFGNNIPDNSKLWDSLVVEIRQTVKKWKFKPLMYDTSKVFEPDTKKKVIEINSGKMSPRCRPFQGRQTYMFILKYNFGENRTNIIKLSIFDIGGQPCCIGKQDDF